MKKALKPCNEPGCPNLTREGYCEQHKRTKPAYDQYRESAAKRGYNGKWRQARAGYLSKHPLCDACLMQGRRTPATVVISFRIKATKNYSGTRVTGSLSAGRAPAERQQRR